MTDRQQRIIRALRHGPLDQFAIATETGDAPFNVRGDLKALRRERIVVDHLTAIAHVWELTTRGMELAWAGNQLQLINGDSK